MCDLPLFGGHGLAVRKGVRRMPHEQALPRVLVVIILLRTQREQSDLGGVCRVPVFPATHLVLLIEVVRRYVARENAGTRQCGGDGRRSQRRNRHKRARARGCEKQKLDEERRHF